MDNNNIVYIPHSETDIESSKLKVFTKKYKDKKTGTWQEAPIPYIPQPEVHRFIAEYFGLNSKIEILDRQVLEVTTTDHYTKKPVSEPCFVLMYRITYYVETNGQSEERFVDCIGGANIQSGDINRAIQIASTAAFKNLLKKLGKGLEAYELDDVDNPFSAMQEEPEANSKDISAADLIKNLKNNK
jgi:hypothetical protein